MTAPQQNIDKLVQSIRSGEKRSLARGITIIENDYAGKEQILSQLITDVGGAWRIGVAGPPGVGKSTLTMQIAKVYRALDKHVGIIAVDPTSPFTGGALLGDRIRMNELFNDPGVFIRSMATRGSLGGLAVAATEAADLLDAAGKSIVILETVGIGQSELDVSEACDVVLLVLAPESGDGVQALKAGFMEIADIFVVNKSDREGADKTVVELTSVISMHKDQEWEIPVVQTIATENSGIENLAQKINAFFEYLNRNDLLERRRKEHLLKRVRSIVRTMLKEKFWSAQRLENLQKIIDQSENLCTPYGIARKLVDNFMDSIGNDK